MVVNDHSDSERGNPLPPQGLLFPISIKGSFICKVCICMYVYVFMYVCVYVCLCVCEREWIHIYIDKNLIDHNLLYTPKNPEPRISPRYLYSFFVSFFF